jgi:nitroimidazol reductase NimA-like FMN-containing flavoprotein (pyridoxamine 5'-phosphate oxidase superfamily)
LTDAPPDRYTPTEKSRARRLPDRARYDAATIYSILDAGFVCHVGYVIRGEPLVTPTAYWREGDHVYWHGSHASRMLGEAAGHSVCLTVTHVDGLVVARSAFHHSLNYRSVMLFGRPARVEDEADKLGAMQRFVERMYPGQWSGLRPVTNKEMKATTVLHMKIDEASAKIRSGLPKDDPDDYALPIWAGVVPIERVHGVPQPDPRLEAGIDPPDYLASLRHLGMSPTPTGPLRDEPRLGANGR